MEKRETKSFITLQRFAALPYNHYLKQEVKKIRQKYRIPDDATLAKDWFKHMLQEYRNSTLAFLLTTEHIFLPHTHPVQELNLEEELRDLISSKCTGMQTMIETDVPFEKEVLLLLYRFGIPYSTYFVILLYVLTYNEEWLHPVHLRPDANPRFITGTGDINTLTVIINGIYPWTTKEEWDDLWEGYIKDYMEDLASFLKGREFHRKKSLAEQLLRRFKRWYQSSQLSLDRQMKRWSEWYQMVEIEGKPIKTALEQWEKTHADQVPEKDIDESTVSKAVTQFRKIITPKSKVT